MAETPHASVRLLEAVERLAAFLEQPLTGRIAQLEHDLEGRTGEEAAGVADRAGVDGSLFDAALDVRAELGRINDLIHAVAITMMLPRILEPQERLVRRPSLAAGNDPTRPYDLETDRRVAEFKLSAWKGADAMRKRQTFKDLVTLAADDSGRRPELYVVGEEPIRFLRTSRSTAAWALDRSPPAAKLFADRFSPLATEIADFTAGRGARVRLVNLSEVAPDLMNRLV